ncbi:microtubule-associated protein RP/EB family member 1-like [Drosophila biarmipes]|uniref:microtubule-associated protein RP/EB family member 1-like n=1 Tax=Drosophila biarmipes TaxID=125945 RepID=UPI0007E6BAC4|nr:microtubule-associated protein RP/EB family member 1-like [Drosophila biarmipes]
MENKERALTNVSATIRKWVKELLEIDIACIEELCSGAIYCQILDMIFEDVVPLGDVIFATNAIADFRKNLEVLRECLYVLQIPLEVPVEDLAWCAFEANLNFAANFYQCFKQLTTKNLGRMQSYDPLAARTYQRFFLAPLTFVSGGIKGALDLKEARHFEEVEDLKVVLDIKDKEDIEGVEDVKDVGDLENSNEDNGSSACCRLKRRAMGAA